MSRVQQVIRCCLSSMLVLTALLLGRCDADAGTAGHYYPPYTPTACYGNDSLQFSSSLFAAAGEEIWDNGAACGRQYMVRCKSADWPKACRPAGWILVRIVDQASRSSSDRSTMLLPRTAYQAIADLAAQSINIEFELV